MHIKSDGFLFKKQLISAMCSTMPSTTRRKHLTEMMPSIQSLIILSMDSSHRMNQPMSTCVACQALFYSTGGNFETLTSTRALREAIKSIKTHGVKMEKFCRIDMLLQKWVAAGRCDCCLFPCAHIRWRISFCLSVPRVFPKSARAPPLWPRMRFAFRVKLFGEQLTGASGNLREAGGNAVAVYTFSSVEQYIPLFFFDADHPSHC